MSAEMAGSQTYRVHARRDGPGVSTASTRSAELRFDTGVDLADALFGPADLLAAAFAGCLLKGVERFSHLLPFRYEAASVEVELDREERPPRVVAVRYELRVATDEPPHRVELLHRNLTSFGTIYNTIAAACRVSGEIRAEPPHPASEAGRRPGPG